MKYKERDAMVGSLRDLADFIEDHGLELPTHIQVSASMNLPYYEPKTFTELTDKQKKAMVKRTVRALKPAKKTYSDTALTISRKFGSKITLSMYVSRNVVCEAVKTGNLIKHAATYIPERIEEEVEWRCTDPLLKASE